jgi:hypothetical protein
MARAAITEVSSLVAGLVLPLPGAVELAHHARARGVRPVVELLLDLLLDERALLLDDQNFFQPRREAAHRFGLERPRHVHLEDAQAHAARGGVVDAERGERLPQVRVRLPRGDEPEPCARAVQGDAVQSVRARVRQRGEELEVLESGLRIQHEVRVADVEPALGKLEVGGRVNLHVRRIHDH